MPAVPDGPDGRAGGRCSAVPAAGHPGGRSRDRRRPVAPRRADDRCRAGRRVGDRAAPGRRRRRRPSPAPVEASAGPRPEPRRGPRRARAAGRPAVRASPSVVTVSPARRAPVAAPEPRRPGRPGPNPPPPRRPRATPRRRRSPSAPSRPTRRRRSPRRAPEPVAPADQAEPAPVSRPLSDPDLTPLMGIPIIRPVGRRRRPAAAGDGARGGA